MRANSKIMKQLLNIARDDSRIRLAFQTGSRVNPAVSRDKMQDYDIIYLVTKVEEFSVDSSFLDGFDFVFVYSPEISKRLYKEMKEEINYSVLLREGAKIDFKFLPVSKLDDLIDKHTLLSLLVDKDNLIQSLPISSDVGLRTMRPTKNEFEQLVYEFFYRAIETLPYLYRSEQTGASYAYRYVQDCLLKILAWQIGYGQDYKVNMGKNYRHMDQHIGEDHKDIYNEAMTYGDIDGLWKSLFASLSLFRRVGLDLADKLGFSYPKNMDVELVRQIREVKADYDKPF